MFYLNTIEQLFLFVEQLDQLEVCLPYSRLLTAIPILAVFQNLRWNSNKTSLVIVDTFCSVIQCRPDDSLETRQDLPWLSILASRPGAQYENLEAIILSRYTNFVLKSYLCCMMQEYHS